MFHLSRIIAVALLLITSGGCYTLIKQPAGQQPRRTGADPRVVQEYQGETLFTATTSLPWTEVGFARTVGSARELLARVRPDSSSNASAMSTDFIRRMLIVVTWGVSPPAELVIDDVTSAGGKLHVFIRADYGDFRPTQPPPSSVQSPVVVGRLPLHDGDVVMHMSPRYAWSEAQRRWVLSETQWSAIGDLDRVRVEFQDWDLQPYADEDFILD